MDSALVLAWPWAANIGNDFFQNCFFLLPRVILLSLEVSSPSNGELIWIISLRMREHFGEIFFNSIILDQKYVDLKE